MSNILTKSINKKLSRRTFLKASAAATTLAALGDKLLGGPVSTLVEGVAGAATEDVWIPTICRQCGVGPQAILVHRVDGVAVGLEGNRNFEEQEALSGRVCPKALGLIQKAYYPYRVKAPMKRTNPEKGFQRDPVTGEVMYDPETGHPIPVDPGWVEISWDEALDTVATWLKDAMEEAAALEAEGKYGNIGLAWASQLMDTTHNGTFPEFRAALAKHVLLDDTIRGGGGISCYMSEHIFCTWVHNQGTGSVDIQHNNWQMCSKNYLSAYFTEIPTGIWAEAVQRGMKLIQVNPQGTVNRAYADEWLPIKPGTDTALYLAMNYVIVHELGTGVCDVPFLKTMTNSPYLVGPGGYFLRHSTSKKPLVWDSVANTAKEYDDATIGDFALEGTYIASGVEVNGLGVEFAHVDVQVKPAYQVLKDHLLSYAPEWAETICDIPAATIRRLAQEFINNAQIGATIEIEGKVLPLRPAAIGAGRSSNNGWGTVDNIAAIHIANMLVGALNVPGGHGNASSAKPGKDGMAYNGIVPIQWQWPPRMFGCRELVPISGGKHATLHQLGPYLLANPGIAPIPKPLGYINYRSNPMISVLDHTVAEAAIKRFPWAWAFAYIISETNSMCDILLPNNTDLETSHIASAKTKWGWRGTVCRQRVVEPPFNCREIGDISTELADRAGILADYNFAINEGYIVGGDGIPVPGGIKLRPQDSLELNQKYLWEDILNRKFLSATNGTKDLAWFKTNGATYSQVPKWPSYGGGHRSMVAQKLRYCLPYAEYAKTEGEKLQKNLDENGIDWWDTKDYTPLPEWRDRSIFYEGGPEYDLHCITTRSILYAWANNVMLPWNFELAEHMVDQAGVIMNADAAATRGISNGDEVWIESPTAKKKGRARLVQEIRPDTICLVQQMGNWVSPVSKDRGWPILNAHIPGGPKWIEKLSGGKTNMAMVKVYKA